ncbi:MAG: hypothetical protein C3F13_15525 [Anaerolineales bacterium]|nr:MAG: hypothetical protein C3F13_15525 [Anaerolineales bacterium]
MPILDQWEIPLTIDDVLQAQGADPQVIRARRPALVTATEHAIERSNILLEPRILFEKFQVKHLVHERLELLVENHTPGKAYLSGELVVRHLARAEEVVVMVATIGNQLDDMVSSLFKVDPVIAVALDGVGSAAVEKLAIQAANHFEASAHKDGLNTTIPLNPGMVGWPVDQGQPEIFSLLDSQLIQVDLTDSCMMSPNKSLSMVLGIGRDVSPIGSSCDYCSLNGVCRYQNHYAS